MIAGSKYNVDEAVTRTDGATFFFGAVLPSPVSPILSERRPIHIEGMSFTVVAEQTTTDIAGWHRRATTQLFTASLLLMFAGCLVLYGIGWMTSRRITRLRRQLDDAVDAQGRVRQFLPRVSRSDEIGDLSNSFAEVIERLRQYNTYLEDMSSRLAHELRTPVTVIRSSLDNLSMEALTGDAQVYLERANQGAARLASILSSMTEATRLEQSLDAAEVEIFDLAEVVRGCIKGYELAWPDREFSLSVEAEPVKIDGLPEAIAQMLDTLVRNALDFSPPDKPSRVRLTVA
ncbi:MAG: proteobacterial dedicated sortase system histidine kinase, partial [Pseudomonadales bacterium]|nr:proteobacterial dedicated sortase system histidine kinase [Pseudomonadales bacterium]